MVFMMNKLSKIFFLLMVFFFVNLWSQELIYSDQPEVDKRINQLIDLGLDSVDRGNFDQSFKYFEEIKATIPDHPAGYFFKSSVVLWIMIHFREYDLEKDFLDESERGIKVAERFLKKNRDDVWGTFYHAGLLGFKGIYYFETGSFFSAFFDGLKGVDLLRKVRKLDDSIVDVQFGLGLYNFWSNYYYYKILRDRKAKAKKQVGIDELLDTVKRGKYTKDEAAKALLRIYYEEEEYDKVIELGSAEVDKYPNCLFCQRYVAFAYLKKGEIEKSNTELESIIQKISNSEYNNEFGIREADNAIVANLITEGKYTQAKLAMGELNDWVEREKKVLNKRPKIYKENFSHLRDRIEKNNRTIKDKLKS